MKDIFEIYLKETTKLSETTIKRYLRAIEIISVDVNSVINLHIDLYEYFDFEKLQNINEQYKLCEVLKEKNDKGQRFYTSALKKYKECFIADKIGEFLEWNDRNGSYTHNSRVREGFRLLSYEESVVLFYGALHDNIYYDLVDNVFELEYREVIDIAKRNNVYKKTEEKLELLINSAKPDNAFFRSLL